MKGCTGQHVEVSLTKTLVELVSFVSIYYYSVYIQIPQYNSNTEEPYFFFFKHKKKTNLKST